MSRSGSGIESVTAIDFRRLFDESPTGMAVLSRDGRWLQVNRALCEMLGYLEEDLLGREFSAVAHPDDSTQGAELTRRLVAGESSGFTVDKRYLRKDGGEIWIKVTSAPIRDRTGEPLHVVLHAEDITQARVVERELARERSLLVESQAAARIGSWELDLETGVQRWSLEQFELYGVDPAGAVPALDELLAWVHPDDRPGVVAGLREHMASGESFTDEYRVMHPKLGTRVLVVRGRYLKQDPESGRPARLAGTTHDVTAEREAQEERWELAERQRLLLASLPDALVVLFDSELRCVMLQGRILSALAIDARRFIGAPVTELLPEQAEIIVPLIERALAGETGSVESPPVAGRTYLFEVAPYRLDDGSIAGAFAVGRDISGRLRAEEQLRLFATIVQQSTDAIIVRSPEGVITQWNDGATRIYGYTAQEAIGQSTNFLVPPDRDGESDELLETAIEGEGPRTVNTSRVCKDGSVIQVALTIAPIVAPDGSLLGISGVARDITAETRAQQLLLNSERQLYDAQALAHVGSWERELSAPRAVLSAELCRILGQPVGFSPNSREFLATVHEDDRDQVLSGLRAAREGVSGDSEYRIVRPDGEIRYVHALRNPRSDSSGRVTHLFGAVQDVTERKQYEAQLHRLATHDSLTGLPNRRTFDERIAAELARARRHGRSLCLAVLDIDHFKQINDTLGHPVGDTVLVSVAEVLRDQIRGDEVIARVGGEEFAWILPDADVEGALVAVRRCLDAVAAATFELAPSVTISGGICAATDDLDVVELYRLADNALLTAKQKRNQVLVADGS